MTIIFLKSGSGTIKLNNFSKFSPVAILEAGFQLSRLIPKYSDIVLEIMFLLASQTSLSRFNWDISL